MITFRIFGVRVVVTIWFAAIIAAVLLFGSDNIVYCLAFMAAHEIGHTVPLLLLGGRVCAFRMMTARLEIITERTALSVKGELLCLFGGSLANLFLAGVLAAFDNGELAAINVIMAAFNLLPVSGLDGGEIAALILSGRFGERAAAKIVSAVSFALGAAAAFAGLRAALSFGNPTIFLFGIYIIISTFINIRYTKLF